MIRKQNRISELSGQVVGRPAYMQQAIAAVTDCVFH